MKGETNIAVGSLLVIELVIASDGANNRGIGT